MKKYTAFLLSLLMVCLLFPTAVHADGNGTELVDVTWNGVTSGPSCEATVTLYQPFSTTPIDAAYVKMWGTFRLVITDAGGNVVLSEDFTSASKTISLTEPGDYYACVYTARGELQGLSSPSGYTPLRQHFTVIEIYEPTVYDEQVELFVMSCDAYPEDHDRAFREYLYNIQDMVDWAEDYSMEEGAAYMEGALADHSDPQYAELYKEFRANEGYAVMEVTYLGVPTEWSYDTNMLVDDSWGFWSGECWRYLVDGIDLPIYEDLTILPYAEYMAEGGGDGFAEMPEEEPADEDGGQVTGGASPLPFVAAGAVVVIGGAAVLLTRKKKNSGK